MGLLKIIQSIPKAITIEKTATTSVSIDVTNVCNLRCKHCYYFMKEYQQKRLSDEEWIEKIKEIKVMYPDVLHCTWVGGEPMLKKELIMKGMEFFRFNWMVTNGTMPIPTWKGMTFFVSIDGTKEYHDYIRGSGMYDRSKNNVLNSKAKIYLHMVVNSKNSNCLEELVSEWSKTNASGIEFSFHTPMPNAEDELYIEGDEKNSVIDRLINLKKEYRSFIAMSETEINLFRPGNFENIIGPNCLLMKGVTVSFDSDGNIKKPCVMGPMDCSRCGCVIPYMLYAGIVKKDLRAPIILAGKL